MSKIAITKITIDPRLQLRESLNWETVNDYTAAIEAGENLPPLSVVYDGKHYWLYDGFHRVEGFKGAGRKQIDCDVVEGTFEDALWAALAANHTHGLRRTNADKRRAVEVALKQWPEKSDRLLARQCGVSPTTVGTARNELSNLDSCPKERIGADGKKRRAPAKKVPRDTSQAVAEPKVAQPDGDAGQFDDWQCPDCGRVWEMDLSDCPHCEQVAEFDIDTEVNAAIEAFQQAVAHWPVDHRDKISWTLDILQKQDHSTWPTVDDHPEVGDAEETGRKPRGVGVRRANEAIDCLKLIPKDDALRERAFQIVSDWTRKNK